VRPTFNASSKREKSHTTTSLDLHLSRIPFRRTSSGKIVYDTFSASNGTVTDVSWTIIEDSELNINGNWTVEGGKFKSVSLDGTTVYAYPADVNVTNFIWEAKVRPMQLTKEGPEIVIGDLPINSCSLAAVFDYYHIGNVLRVMIAPGPYGTPHSTYETTSFVMNEGVWYTMKVIVSGSNMKCYVDNILKFDVVDSNLETAPPRVLRHGGYYNREWGYWDDVKVWKSNMVNVTSLKSGQKVELYDENDTLIQSSIVEENQTFAILNVSSLSFPFTGYFKI
jgi:hypothetical protein